MPDITKCGNENCPLKQKCYRWTAKDSTVQSYTKFNPVYIKRKWTCEGYYVNG